MNPSRSQDKISRTNSVADLFRSGMVWAPLGHRWVEQVREEMAAVPYGEYDEFHNAAVWGAAVFATGEPRALGGPMKKMRNGSRTRAEVLLKSAVIAF